MPVTLPYTAHVTVEDVLRDALKSTTLTETDNGYAIRRAIRDISARIETSLDRQLVVRSYVQHVDAYQWRIARGGPRYSGRQLRWECLAKFWPVVQVQSAEVGWYGSTRSDDPISQDPRTYYQHRRFWTADPYDFEVTYFAGFRRTEQTLADLQAATDPDTATGTPLADLTVLPAVLPSDVTDACTRMVLARLFQAENKMWGAGSRSRLVGKDKVMVEQVDRGFEKRQLSHLLRYRRMSA